MYPFLYKSLSISVAFKASQALNLDRSGHFQYHRSDLLGQMYINVWYVNSYSKMLTVMNMLCSEVQLRLFWYKTCSSLISFQSSVLTMDPTTDDVTSSRSEPSRVKAPGYPRRHGAIVSKALDACCLSSIWNNRLHAVALCRQLFTCIIKHLLESTSVYSNVFLGIFRNHFSVTRIQFSLASGNFLVHPYYVVLEFFLPRRSMISGSTAWFV